MKHIKFLPVLVATTLCTHLHAAEPAAFQASLTPDIAIEAKDTRINGLSLSIWGQNPQSGVALGFVNGSTGQSKGFTWGLVNYAEAYNGVTWGFVNFSTGEFNGWQSGLFNYSEGPFYGLQSGWINVSQEFTGLQIGLVNYATKLDGVQVGFVNVALNNPWFSEFPDKLATGFPIVNWSF